MKTKNILAYILLFSTLLFTACNSFEEESDAGEVNEIDVKISVQSLVPGVTSYEGFSITFKNVKYGTVYTSELSESSVTQLKVIPGIYQIDVSGEFIDESHDTYLLNGNKVNFPVVENGSTIDITVNGLRKNDLIFKEIFYAGTANNYFRNQFYEIYNNSEDQIIYLDGVHFANLAPLTATTKLPLWPAEDGDRYVYAERVWKFPGNGTDYPLAPGESCVISQFAANHQLPQYNPNSPINGFSSEFEFNMDNKNYPDQPAEDMVHVFYDGLAIKGSLPQYLTSVFGGAYVIFKPLAGDVYDPVNDTSMRTKDLSVTATKLYAKIPITYVIDAVEAGHNESMLTAKRVPAALDRGMTYVGATYNSLGVARKKVGEHKDGTPILQDLNNSTEDFDRGVVPEFRRYGSKMPSWNHTLSNK